MSHITSRFGSPSDEIWLTGRRGFAFWESSVGPAAARQVPVSRLALSLRRMPARLNNPDRPGNCVGDHEMGHLVVAANGSGQPFPHQSSLKWIMTGYRPVSFSDR